jgi:hypothetical protein
MAAKGEEDRKAATGLSFIWEYLRRRLETEGEAEAALQLQHYLMARLAGRLKTGQLETLQFNMFQRVSDYSVLLNAEDGELMGWSFPLLAEDPGKTVSVDEATKKAEAVAMPPPGAVLTDALYDEIGDAPVFIARWEHHEESVPVERDYIQVLVNGKSGRPFALSQKWHEVNLTATKR